MKTAIWLGAGASALLLSSGCGPLWNDGDADGLSNSFEQEIGTDPELFDSDADGFTDAEEHLSFHDANDPEDFPRSGDYPRFPRPSDLGPTELAMGAVAPDWQRLDQHGEAITLHEFYGNVVLIRPEWFG